MILAEVFMDSMADGTQRIGWFDRLFFIGIGCFLGYLFGRVQELVRCNLRAEKKAQKASEKVEAVVARLDAIEREKNERGAIDRRRVINGVLIFITIAVLVFASFRTGTTNSQLKEAQSELIKTQAELKGTNTCTVQAIGQLTEAINARTTVNSEATAANIELQRAQLKFLSIVSTPGNNEEAGESALDQYLISLGAFIQATDRVEVKADKFPYPTSRDFYSCLRDKGREGAGKNGK